MKKTIKFLLNIIFSLIIISTGLNAKMYIENVAADNTDASGRLIPGGIDLKNIEVRCWLGGDWHGTIKKNSYLTHDCGSSTYYKYDPKMNLHAYSEDSSRLAPADVYYQGQPIGEIWKRIYRQSSTSKTWVTPGTFDSIGNPHYCLKMVNGNLTVTYNGENNCPRVSPMANLFSLVRK